MYRTQNASRQSDGEKRQEGSSLVKATKAYDLRSRPRFVAFVKKGSTFPQKQKDFYPRLRMWLRGGTGFVRGAYG